MSRSDSPRRDLWADLDPPAGGTGVSRRRVHPQSRHDLWAQVSHPAGSRSVLLDVHAPDGRRHWASLRSSQGVRVHVESPGAGRQTLLLSENEERFAEMFSAVATDILDLVAALDEDSAVMDKVASRLLRWQVALRTDAGTGLGPSQQLALFGELEVLAELTDLLPHTLVAASWTGPERALQDFQLTDGSIEVKTTRRADPRTFVVHGARQLDSSACGRLFVAHLVVDVRSDGPARTLPDVVEAARAQQTSAHGPEGRAALDDRLTEAGYLDVHAERYLSHLHRTSLRWFDVRDGFPRLLLQDLPAGVGEVTYGVDVSACEPFETDAHTVAAVFVAT